MNDGYVKFQCEWEAAPPLPAPLLAELMHWRDEMHRRYLIGFDAAQGVGFGNISFRCPPEQGLYIISGTRTGQSFPCSPADYTAVIQTDIPQNKLWCRGPVSASSESLTHAAVYQADPACQAVIHVHHRLWWQQSLDRIPTTSASAPYGSPEMAEEVMRLFRETDVRASGVFVMAGHEEGLVAFGPSLPAAVNAIVNLPARL